MTKMNAVGWFDIYVDDLDRAVAFYEAMLGSKLEPMGDPTGESQMMSFPAEMSVYGAGGALTKSPHTGPASAEPLCTSWSRIAPCNKSVWLKPEALLSGQNFLSEISAGFFSAKIPKAT